MISIGNACAVRQTRINLARALLLGVAIAAFGAVPASAADTLNALIWCDHNDPNLLKPFEDANKVKVNVKEF